MSIANLSAHERFIHLEDALEEIERLRDQYSKDRADIGTLHANLEHQVDLLIADNKLLRAALKEIDELDVHGKCGEIAFNALNQQLSYKTGI